MVPNLSIRQLQTFREVMRSGSVSAASRVLGRSQPAVSAMLANLEVELGFDLFERRKGRLIPKPEAHFFFEETQEILDRINCTAQTMREIGNLDRGRLKIASLPGASFFLLPQIVADFIKDRPDVDVSIMTRTSIKVREWIASQQYDVGIVEMPEQHELINIRPIELECMCALRKDDPLAAKSVLTPDDLDNAPMAALFIINGKQSMPCCCVKPSNCLSTTDNLFALLPFISTSILSNIQLTSVVPPVLI